MKRQILFLLFVLFVGNAVGVFNVSELITQQGYPVENYWFESVDGFLLGVQRIPHGRNNNVRGPKPVAFLQHGLLDCASTWVNNLYYESLGFILADAGFDVFLGNARGNTYSQRNVLNNNSAMWNLVDWDNMIAIDLPTMVDNVLSISGQSSLVYVGHSQGTTMALGAFSTNPTIAAKVDLFVGLAPVATVKYQTSPLVDILADLDIAQILYYFGEEEFLPSDWVIDLLADTICVEDPTACEDIIFLLCGWDTSNFNQSRVPLYMTQTPAGTSVRNMVHWAQAVDSGNFQKFDYGSATLNMAHYGQSTPPLYPLGDLVAPPVAFFAGGKDMLADPTDFQNLLKSLPAQNQPIYVQQTANYNHLDFVWGENANTIIYAKVVELAQKYAKVKSN